MSRAACCGKAGGRVGYPRIGSFQLRVSESEQRMLPGLGRQSEKGSSAGGQPDAGSGVPSMLGA